MAQEIARPIVNDACVVSLTSEFTTTSSIINGSVPDDTMFSLLLSDKSGQFSNSIELAVTRPINNELIFTYSYPELDGEGSVLASDRYRVKIEQIGGELESDRSNRFSAYFYDGTVLEVTPRSLCGPEGGTLSANVDLDEYIWYKDGVIIPGENSRTLDVSESGEYFFSPNYGVCNQFIPEANSKRAVVDISMMTLVDVNITASGTSIICLGDSVTLSSDFTDSGFSYQWTRNGEPILGENGTEITISEANTGGDYVLLVTDSSVGFAECRTSSSNTIIVEVNPSIRLEPPFELFNIPGQSLILQATTSGDNTDITWLKDGVDIPNSNTSSLNVNEPGVYKARISATSPCNGVVESIEEITVSPIGNLKVFTDYDIPNYTECEFDSVGLLISGILIEIPGEDDMPLPNTSFGALEIQWFKDGVDSGLRGQNINFSSALDNGTYEARVFSGTSGPFVSEIPLEVKLNIGTLSVLPALPTVRDGEITTLFLELPENINQDDLNIQWFQDTNIATDSNTNAPSVTNELNVSEPGRYSIEIQFDNCATQTIGPIVVQGSIDNVPNAIIPGSANFLNRDWLLPQQYTLKPNVGVKIYTNSGKEDFTLESNYNGQWPSESSSRLAESLYYYTITIDNRIVKQGSITIVR